MSRRIGQYLVEEWKENLAEKLGRSAEQISKQGLSAKDFSCSQKVILDRPDEMKCVFEKAFCIIDEGRGKVVVFTEHCGYHVFYLSGMKVSEVISKDYWDEDY